MEADCLLIDLGSSQIEYGLSLKNLDAPKVLSSFVSGSNQSFSPEPPTGDDVKSVFTNDEVNDWDNLDKMFKHIVDDCSSGDPLTVVVSCGNGLSKEHSQKLILRLFEDFEHTVGVFMISKTQVSALGKGIQNGFCIHIGDGGTTYMPIYGGLTNPVFWGRSSLGGSTITSSLAQLIEEKNSQLTSQKYYTTVKQYKERYCRVSSNFEVEFQSVVPSSKEIKIGFETLSLDQELFVSSEVLFKPNLFLDDQISLQHKISDAIFECPLDCRSTFVKNMYLFGKTAKLHGIAQRLESELQDIHPDIFQDVKIHNLSGENTTWNGLTRLIEADEIENYFVSRADYEESGPVITRRFFL
eukprot:TRINITY_DN3171_c0_g1_i3.p1 TRINITY_DN3171_c0_g1~~TRINITY_DN3171_c0_g1_i3.p1  ORF type:complete len:355 (-),score=56.21 TRINITY_DN3171_c0_g1_i3:290-1354(-)